MNIVIVESAAKAKTINKYLGADYKVIASYGHVRDLPAKDGSVQPDQDFAMSWAVEADSQKVVNEIAKAVKGADRLILATDPDREGEAISWHLLQILAQKRALSGVAIERVAFNAVTKDAVLAAMANPRAIDEPLVDAYLARRALDYLVGFTLSPVLWRKLPGARSAGRVQSVALRLVCNRETEIEAFKTREYWTVGATLKTAAGDGFEARLAARDGKKLDKFDIPDEKTAHSFRDALSGQHFLVESVEAKDHKRNPAPPFTTSSLQQEASRKFGFSPRLTMQIAQRLYEGIDIGGETVGLITYMRTDGVQIVAEAISQCRGQVEQLFGKKYLPPSPRNYKTKAKNAQEAHEAIRPTDFRRQPDKMKGLKPDEARLYKLIWQRAVASQMASADIERTTVEIGAKGKDGHPYGLRATGSVILFDGFLKLYEEGLDDAQDEEDGRLPKLAAGDPLREAGVTATQHFTEPPPRYSEATLIREMERLGIGRPSTYASTVALLREREYVRLEKKRLQPEDKGRLVTAFLEAFFKRYVEYDFTAYLEDRLDLISDGKLDWKDLLREFWRDFIAAVDETKDLRVAEVLDALNDLLGPHIFPARADGGDPRLCPLCGQGQLSLKVGKFGAFIGCSNYPECRFTRQLKSGEEGGADVAQANGDGLLGADPETSLPVYLKTGRFGPYIQLAEGENGDKPKRASIPAGVDPATISLDYALRLLALPREVGSHPETGKAIMAGFGRYGPYVEHDGKYVKIDADEVFAIGLNRAVALIAEGNTGGKGRRTSSPQAPIKVLGEHPELGGKIEVLSGRYGPYVKFGSVNATVPKELPPENVTMDDALRLIAARMESGGGKRKPAAKAKASKPKAAAAAAGENSADAPAKRKAAPRKAKPKAAGERCNLPRKKETMDVKDRGAKIAAPPAPTKQDILSFIRSSGENIGRKEIARAFGVKGAHRIELKRILKELAADGLIADPRRRMRKEAVPPVTVLLVSGQNREGDLVAVPLHWSEEDDGSPPRILLEITRRYEGPAIGIGDHVLARIREHHDGDDTSESQRFAYVASPIKRLPRDKPRQLGLLREAGGGFRVESIDKKAMKEWRVISGDMENAQDGELVRFETVRDNGSGAASARIIERIGHPQAEKAVSLIAIHNHGLRDIFPEDVLAELAPQPNFSRAGREDLTPLPLVTIDPEDAKDHDDAVWAAPDEDPANEGGVLVIVAIADVSFYVRTGTALDREAHMRGNSVYFPDRVVPMLPEALSNDLCSLREGELRPALAVRMIFDRNGKKRSHRFIRATMRSAAKLSYGQAQAAIDGKPDAKTAPLLDTVLRPLWRAYTVLKEGRDRRAPLDLDLPERKILLDKHGLVSSVVIPPRLEAHKLIEEFMIQANVAAAEALEARKSPLIYRVHDAPAPEKLVALSEFLASLGMNAPKTGWNRPGHFNKVLERAAGTEHAELLNEVVLRSQAQAEYSPANLGHFGLNLRRYAHFTSPIRRYADLIVHRALVSAFSLGEGGLTEAEQSTLGAIAEAISQSERKAMSAERETVDRLIAIHLSERIGDEFPARISGVTRFGLFVKLGDTGADGFVPMGSLGRDYYKYVEAAHAIVGERTGRSYRLGDKVDVRLVEANPSAGALRFQMLSDGSFSADLARLRRRRATGLRKTATKPKGRGKVSSKRKPAGPKDD